MPARRGFPILRPVTKLANPVPIFLDGRGALLDGGMIFVGQPNLDPEVGANQIPLYWDADKTIPAPQPLRTLGGRIVNVSTPSFVYFDDGADYSLTIRDVDGTLVEHVAAALETGGVTYQPESDDLTEISNLSTTSFGRSLLILANQAKLRLAVGLGSSAYLAATTAAEYRANTPNRVITTDQAWAAAVPVPLTSVSGTVAVDLALGLNFTLAMTNDPWTLASPINAKPGQSGFIEIRQDATGNRILNFGAGWKFAGGVDPILSTGPNVLDVLNYEILSDGTAFATLGKAAG